MVGDIIGREQYFGKKTTDSIFSIATDSHLPNCRVSYITRPSSLNFVSTTQTDG